LVALNLLLDVHGIPGYNLRRASRFEIEPVQSSKVHHLTLRHTFPEYLCTEQRWELFISNLCIDNWARWNITY